MTRTISALCLTLLLACGTAYGQQSAKKSTCRILFLDRPSNAPQTLHLFDGTNSREVDLPVMNLSKVYELPPGPMRISMLRAPLDDPDLLPSGAPSAVVPEGIQDFYLVMVSDPSNSVAPVRLLVVDVGNDKLRRGQTMWFNLTSVTFGGTLGSQNIVLQPQSKAIMNAPRRDAGDYPVSLSYRITGNEHLHPICETRWVHDPRVRSLGFVFARGNSRTPRVLVFPDFRATPQQDDEEE